MTDQTLIQVDWVWLFLFLSTLILGSLGAWFRERTTKSMAWSSAFLSLLWLGWAAYTFSSGAASQSIFQFQWVYDWTAHLDPIKLWVLVGIVVITLSVQIKILFLKDSEQPSWGQFQTTLFILAGLILGLVSDTFRPTLFAWILTSLGIVLNLSEGLFENRKLLLSKKWMIGWSIGTLLYSCGLVLVEMQADEIGRYALFLGLIVLFLNVPSPTGSANNSYSRIWYQFSYWASALFLCSSSHSIWHQALVSFHFDLFILSVILISGLVAVRYSKQNSGFGLALGLFGLWNHVIIHSAEGDFFVKTLAASLTLGFAWMVTTLFPKGFRYGALVIVGFASFVFWNEGIDAGYGFWEGVYQLIPAGQFLFYLIIPCLSFLMWVSVHSCTTQLHSRADFVFPAIAATLLGVLFGWNGVWDAGVTLRVVGLVVGALGGEFFSRRSVWQEPPSLKWIASSAKRTQKVKLILHGWLGESYESLGIQLAKLAEVSVILPTSHFIKGHVSNWTEAIMVAVENVIQKILQLTRFWRVKSSRTQVLISWLITLIISLIVILE